MSDRSVLTQTEISNGRKWLSGLPVDTPGSEETFHILPNLLRQKMLLDNIPRCIITQRIVQCGSFCLTWLGSKWIKIRSMAPFLPATCMSHVGVTASDAYMFAEQCIWMCYAWKRCLPGVSVWYPGILAGDWVASTSHLGGPERLRLGQKQTYLRHSSALELVHT